MDKEEKTKKEQDTKPLQEITEQEKEKKIQKKAEQIIKTPNIMPKIVLEKKQGFFYKLKNTWLAKYQIKMKRNGINVPLTTWFAMAIGSSIALGIIGFFMFQIIGLDNPLFLGFILLLVGLDISIGYPVFLEMQRLDNIEKALPDALKQIADTLQAGGTYEFALRELLSSDFGPLNAEIEKVLRKLDEGENMENSLRTLAEDNDSKLIKRSVTIIIDALKTGAALADVLDQISDDIRELRRIGQERKSRTIMGVMLLVAAGAVVAPGLFGINSSVLEFMIKTIIKTNIGTPETIETALITQNFISFLLVFYLFLELLATSVMLALMRDGKAGKTIIYAPILLLIGFTAYYGTRLVAAVSILKGI